MATTLTLTRKQYETMVLLAGHRTSKEIARELGISPHTVDQRIATSIRRLNVANRREAAKAMLCTGIRIEVEKTNGGQ